jgi:two-component system cell cycle sensor histidine kinase/response regulator CckA
MSKSNSPNQEELGILKEMWEYLEDVAFCHDAEGNLIYFSPSCEKVLGYTLEEVGTLNFQRVVAPEFLEDVMTRTERQIRGEPVEQPWDLQLLDKNGNRRWFQIRTRPVYDAQNRLTKVYGVARDINEKKVLEKKLHEYTADLERLVKERTRTLQDSEEKYRQLFENANDAVFIAQDGFIKFANPKANEMTGRSSDELTRVPFTEMIHPSDRQMVLERHRRRLKGEKLESTYSFRILNQEGGELWVQLNASATSWQGEPATLNFLRDITPQKKLEVQLQQAQKMEAIGTLAGGIAHDFNNLLMAIQGNASLTLHDLDPSHPHYEALASIERLVKNGAKLTSQLLGYARKGKYEFRPINLNDLVEETSETIRRTRKEITIHKDLSGDLFAIEADPVQVEQVLFNLYINAADAMPHGGDLILKTSNSSLRSKTGRLRSANRHRYRHGHG